MAFSANDYGPWHPTPSSFISAPPHVRQLDTFSERGGKRIREDGTAAPDDETLRQDHLDKRGKWYNEQEEQAAQAESMSQDCAMQEDGAAEQGACEASHHHAAHAAADVEMSPDRTAHASSSRYSDDMNVFVKGLKMSTRDGDLDQLFGSCGGLKAVRLLRDSNGRFRGCAYVDFSSEEGLARAVALNGTMYNGKPLFVARSQPPARGRGGALDDMPHGPGKGHAHGPGAPAQEAIDPAPPAGSFDARAPFYAGKHHRQRLQLDQGPPAPARGPCPVNHPLSNEELRKLLLGGRH